MHGQFDRPTDDRIGRFASLVADWYWELDADLRYVFHAGRQPPASGGSHDALVGRSRIEVLDAAFPPGQALLAHHAALRAHEPIDMVLPIGASGEPGAHSHVIARPEFDARGRFTGYAGCGRDVTERVRLEERMAHDAAHDALTGICNRRAFEVALAALHTDLGTHRDTDVDGSDRRSLCLLDLDRFKLVNDTAGHAAGDQLLRELVALMRSALHEDELLARLGGDEFGFVLDADELGARTRCDALIEAIACHEFVWEERVHSVGACIGITPLVPGAGTLAELMDRADSACYAAKNNGRNQSVTFSESCEAWHRHRDELASIAAIKAALRANRLRLYMQEIRPVSAQADVQHHEILLRLEQENGTLLSPADFIPVAERFGIMQDLDRWVLDHCLDTLDAFAASGVPHALSINLSGNTLSDMGALERIAATVLAAPDFASSLCFEITETAAIGNLDTVVGFMRELKRSGVRFALDDFGAGLSSFAYLRSLPIDYLKIDGYFIRHLSGDATNRAITAAFIGLSRELGIATVAESVETRGLARQVTQMGVDYVQGYGIARPVDVDETLARLLQSSVRRVVNG